VHPVAETGTHDPCPSSDRVSESQIPWGWTRFGGQEVEMKTAVAEGGGGAAGGYAGNASGGGGGAPAVVV
jgi:hypothetical protein